ncbi:MAG TPA: opacity family porin [Ignavibacteria bacterium]
MKKKSAFFLIFAAFLIIKETYSQPAATVQLIGGYSIPLPDLKGTFGDSPGMLTINSDSNTFFMKSGVNYGLVFKIPIKRKFPINIVGSLLINSFSQNKLYTDTSGYFEADINQIITTVGIGLEYSFSGKKTIFNPYAGIEFTINLFSGQFTTSTGTDPTILNLKGTVRAGIQATAGIDYVLHNNIGVTAGIKYAYANMIGKKSAPDIRPTYYLNDDDRYDQGVFYPARNITYLQLFGGVSFYFGR